jgi:hypothetical protein
MTLEGFIALTDDGERAHAMLGNLFVVPGLSEFRG